MFLSDLDEFVHQAQSLFLEQPARTRYVARYHHQRGKLVVKVTDDHTILQYKTDQQADVKRLDDLQATLLSLMAGMAPEEVALMSEEAQAPTSAGSKPRRPKRRN